MKFWGTTIDPKKAEKFELPVVDNVLPPLDDPFRPAVAIPTITNSHPKPTDYLNYHTSTISRPVPTSPNAASKESDIGSLIADMSKTLQTHKTIFSSVGALILIGLVAGVVLLKRRANSNKNYAPIEADDHPMATLGAVSYIPGRDGVPARSPSGRHPQERVSVGLGFHSSFLDDDDLSTGAGTGLLKYRDEPDDGESTATAGAGRSMPVPEVRVTGPHANDEGTRAS
jgi:kexin